MMPVGFVVKPDDHVTGFHQTGRDGFVVTDLLRFVVRRAVDVDRGVEFLVKEIRLGRAGDYVPHADERCKAIKQIYRSVRSTLLWLLPKSLIKHLVNTVRII